MRRIAAGLRAMLRPAGRGALLLGCALLAAGLPATNATARENLLITVDRHTRPLVQEVVKRLMDRAGLRPEPQLVSPGTGRPLQLFCGGNGPHVADIAITVASDSPPAAGTGNDGRQRNPCRNHDIGKVIDVPLGHVGLALVQSAQGMPLALTRRQLYLALAAKVPVQGRLLPNPYHLWNDIDQLLPARPIRVIGPPPSTPLHDRFVQQVLLPVCRHGLLPYWQARRLQLADPAAWRDDVRRHCTSLRGDGAYMASARKGRAMAARLAADVRLLGIIDLAAYPRSTGLRAVPVDGVVPTPASLAANAYPLAWQVRLLVKHGHRPRVPGIDAFIREILSDAAWGNSGYLARLGLLPPAARTRQQLRQKVKERLQPQRRKTAKRPAKGAHRKQAAPSRRQRKGGPQVRTITVEPSPRVDFSGGAPK